MQTGASPCLLSRRAPQSQWEARREAERVVNPQVLKLVINWEGLAPLRTRRHLRGLGIPRGAAPCYPDIPRLLSTCWVPGQRFLAHSGRKNDEQGTRRSAGDSGRRKLSTWYLGKPSCELFCKINNQSLISLQKYVNYHRLKLLKDR